MSAASASSGGVLVMFAVREEAKHFKPPSGVSCKVVVSGIGKLNAERAIIHSLQTSTPRLVLTCGYAGGLNPQLTRGDVVLDADPAAIAILPKLDAVAGKFFCADRIVVTAADKLALRELTGADAVEMESGVIRALCQQRGIPSATIRVISDDARTDLPMDFNRIAGADGNMNYFKLAGALIKSPTLVPRLMRFQRELAECSRRLGDVLHALTANLNR